MNRADAFGLYGVQQRASRSENTRRKSSVYDWEAEDAVPLRTKRDKTTRSSTSAPKPENQASAGTASAAGRSYRVRDAALRAQQKANAKRAAAGETAEPQHKTPRGRTVPQDRRRTRSAPDSTHNTDRIFHEEASEAQRLAARLRLGFQGKRTLLLAVLVCVLVLFLAMMVYKVFFVISGIDIAGETRYTAQEIVQASGVEDGDNLFSFSSRVVMEDVTLRLPYIHTLAVNRTIPNDVLFTVAEEEAVFWTELYGEVWAVSGSLRLLETVSRKEAEDAGWICLRLPEVERAVVGRVLDFRDDRMLAWIRKVSTEIQKSALYSRITALDVRDPYDLRMVSDDCYLLLFGSGGDTALQLRVAGSVLADSLFDSTVKAQLDLTMDGSTSVIFDDQLSLE
ncbi:MAG: FtsQ-type POTRA domain-containing protein [Clostridia bacterium]|nr:FtsQ-type POTRA domain-containing protein [Clostridia bacterium]